MTVHANMEEYARESRELLAGCLGRATEKAAERLKAGMDAARAADLMEGEVRTEMRHRLFSKVKSERIVDPGYRIQYIGTGMYRRRPMELTVSAVPSRLLDVKSLVPDFAELLGAAMLAASRKAMEMRILETAAEASERSGDGQD